MATRNLTSRFETLRSACGHSPRGGQSNSGGGSSTSLLEPDSGSSSGVAYVLPPQWVDIVETVQSDIKNIQELLLQYSELQRARLKVTFGQDEAQLDRDLDVIATRISQVANERGANLPERERLVRLNVMRGLGADLIELSKKFKNSQKSFLKRLRGQDEVGKEFFSTDSDSKDAAMTLDEALDRGLSESEMAQLQQMNANATEREREIIAIAQSINELAALFNELSVLVIEQGTVLDRIDYNVEQTLFKVREGVEELQVAEDHSKKAYTMKLIFFLIFIIIILTCILIFKHVKFSGN